MASTYTNLLVHIVFSTKKRTTTLSGLKELHAYVGGVVNHHGAVAIAVGGVEDHVHVLASLKSTTCVADLVRETKKAVSAWLKERGTPVVWQEGYGAFSVGMRRTRWRVRPQPRGAPQERDLRRRTAAHAARVRRRLRRAVL